MSDDALNLPDIVPVAPEMDTPNDSVTPAESDTPLDAVAPAAIAEIPAEVRPQYEAAMGGISLRRALGRAIGIGLTFAGVGALTGIHEFAGQVLPHIIAPESAAGFQETTVGLPVPHLLDWNPAKIEFLQIVADLSPLLVAVLLLCFYGGLALKCASALNPTFRLLRVHSASANFRWFALNGAAWRKTLRAGLLPGLALALVWLATMALPGRSGDFAGEIRFVALGMALWTAFGARGAAGDFQRRELQKVRPALMELWMQGAVFGLAAYVLMQVAAPAALGPLLTRWQELGTFHRGYLNFIAVRYLGGLAAAWFGAGSLLLAIGQPQLRVSQRLGVLVLPLLALWGAVALQRPFQPDRMAARYDLTPAVHKTINMTYDPRYPASGVPEGIQAARELAGRTEIAATTTRPERSLLLFTQSGAAIARQAPITVDGLPLDSTSLVLVRDFLDKRHYETALSWTATRHLFNVHAANFDTTAAMSDLLLDLAHGPHLLQCNGTLFSMFHTCAASPQNLALLDLYANNAQFARPDREGLRQTGELYRRFGATDKAALWFRRADMPKTFMAKIAKERPMFHAGRVVGILRWNGRPLAGADVAAVPQRLNGLTPEMAPRVYRYALEIQAQRQHTPLFGPYHPQPLAFRFLSASAKTDANGGFQLQNLTEGSYWLLVRLPEGMELLPPQDARLTLRHAPQNIDLNYKSPAFDAGTIDLTFSSGAKF